MGVLVPTNTWGIGIDYTDGGLTLHVQSESTLDADVPKYFFFSSRRRHTRLTCDWSSDVCSSDLESHVPRLARVDLEVVELPGRVLPRLHRLPVAQQDGPTRRARLTADLPVEGFVRRTEERRVGKERSKRGARNLNTDNREYRNTV